MKWSVLVGASWLLFVTSTQAAETGKLAIESLNAGVRLYIDDTLIGKTPIKTPSKLEAGKHKLKATKLGFAPFELEVLIEAGKQFELMVDLIPLSGVVRFTTNVPGAQVRVDGKPLGNTPLNKTINLGDHEIMLIKKGYRDYVTLLNVKAGEKHFVEAELMPLPDQTNLAADNKPVRSAQKQKTPITNELPNYAPHPQTELSRVSPQATACYADWYKKWWFWTITTAVVVTAVSVPLAVGSPKTPGLHDHLSPI